MPKKKQSAKLARCDVAQALKTRHTVMTVQLPCMQDMQEFATQCLPGMQCKCSYTLATWLIFLLPMLTAFRDQYLLTTKGGLLQLLLDSVNTLLGL